MSGTANNRLLAPVSDRLVTVGETAGVLAVTDDFSDPLPVLALGDDISG